MSVSRIFHDRRQETVAERVRAIVLAMTDGDLVGDGAYLSSDLGLDSLEIYDLKMRIEIDFGHAFEDEEFVKASTVSALIALVKDKLGGV
ncbi:MAG: hypothetical protein A3E78_07410 [Alphaproteobacteria bacterium RIFCSPHIGHO2_12_FULL_63_12]|nr:MAG: hypothetical protein A3E78_07410 [Alphaproteobacteria bacterium RIFCSPHIGHO2_12_FULL_63_12]